MMNQIIYAVDNSIRIDKRTPLQFDEKQVTTLLTNSANYFITEDLAVVYALKKFNVGFRISETYPIFKVQVKPSTDKDIFFKVTHISSAKIYLDPYYSINKPLNFDIGAEEQEDKDCSYFISPMCCFTFFPPPKNKSLDKDLPCTSTNFTDYYKLQPIRQALTFLCVAKQKIAEQKDWLPTEITEIICRNIVGRR